MLHYVFCRLDEPALEGFEPHISLDSRMLVHKNVHSNLFVGGVYKYPPEN